MEEETLDLKEFAKVNEGDPNEIFELDIVLDKGSSGQVWRAKNVTNGQHVAIKIIDKTHGGFSQLALETRYLDQCRSHFITGYHGCWITAKSIWIAMELADLGSMETVMQVYMYHAKFSEDELGILCAGVLLALDHIHEKDMIHRDVKGKNILVTRKGEIKLADLGIAAKRKDKTKLLTQKIGSPHWMAPEIIIGGGYNSKVDIWALGITLIELADGSPPYAETPPLEVLNIISEANSPQLEEPESWSTRMNEFVSQCLRKDMEKRPSAKELLQHDFVRPYVSKLRHKDYAILQNISRRIYDIIEDWRTDDYLKSVDEKDEHFDPRVKAQHDINESFEDSRDLKRAVFVKDEESNEVESVRDNDEINSWIPPGGRRSLFDTFDSMDLKGAGGRKDSFDSLESVEETKSQRERRQHRVERERYEMERSRLEREKEEERKALTRMRAAAAKDKKLQKGSAILSNLGAHQRVKASAKEMAKYLEDK